MARLDAFAQVRMPNNDPRARYAVSAGSRFPAGATLVEGGVNFCIFFRDAAEVELLLYETPTSPEPFQIIALSAENNRTFYYWHVFVEGLPVHVAYTWRLRRARETLSPGVIVVVAFELSYQEESEVQVEDETNVFC